jgi:hypothetical protein
MLLLWQLIYIYHLIIWLKSKYGTSLVYYDQIQSSKAISIIMRYFFCYNPYLENGNIFHCLSSAWEPLVLNKTQEKLIALKASDISQISHSFLYSVFNGRQRTKSGR